MEWLLGGGIILALLYIMGLILSLLGFCFWIWMIVEAAMKEPDGSDKIVWVIIVVLLPFIGSLLYFLIRRPARIAQHGR